MFIKSSRVEKKIGNLIKQKLTNAHWKCAFTKILSCPPQYFAATLYLQIAADALVHETSADVRVHGGEGIVQQIDVGVLVDRPRQVDSGTLAAAEIHPPFAHDGAVAVGKRVDVRSHLADSDHLLVPRLVHRLTEQDVLPHGGHEDPRLLADVVYSAAALDTSARQRQFLEDRLQQAALTRTHLAHDGDKASGWHGQVYITQCVVLTVAVPLGVHVRHTKGERIGNRLAWALFRLGDLRV